MKVLVGCILLMFTLEVGNPTYAIPDLFVFSQYVKEKEVVSMIKKHESYVPHVYRDSKGYAIGYGHRLLNNDTLTYVSELEAEELLLGDFNKIKTWVSGINELEGNQLLAVSCFTYNCGTVAYMESGLRRAIEKNDSAQVAKEWVRWCKYRNKKGQLKISSGLLERRKTELALYYEK